MTETQNAETENAFLTIHCCFEEHKHSFRFVSSHLSWQLVHFTASAFIQWPNHLWFRPADHNVSCAPFQEKTWLGSRTCWRSTRPCKLRLQAMNHALKQSPRKEISWWKKVCASTFFCAVVNYTGLISRLLFLVYACNLPLISCAEQDCPLGGQVITFYRIWSFLPLGHMAARSKWPSYKSVVG